MIENIKRLVLENEGVFKKDIDFSTAHSSLHVSKFFHGDPRFNKKILFFVSVSGTPLCIFKVARKTLFNDCIKREIAGMSEYGLPGSTPTVFLSGDIDGQAYVCEEIVTGTPAGISRQKELIPFVLSEHKHAKKGEKIIIEDILDLFKDLPLKGYEEFDLIWEELSKRKNDVVYTAKQHGDMTYKNIILDKNNKPKLIDFENFGLRSVWGIDLVHYIARMIYGGVLHPHIPDALFGFVSGFKKEVTDSGLTDRDLENIFLIDWLFDAFQKDYKSLYARIIPRMEQIYGLNSVSHTD